MLTLRGIDSMKSFLAVVLLSITCFIVACNPSWPHRYDTLRPKVMFHGFGTAVVLVRDNRSGVLDGLLTPQEVGVVESINGNSHAIQTATGHALAQDVGVSICNSLNLKGFDCVPLVSGRAPIEDELDYVRRNYNPVRIVFMTIEEWDVKVLLKAKLAYGFNLRIYNGRGELRTSLNTSGKEESGSVTAMNPAKEASVKIPEAMNGILSSLLSHPQVVTNMDMSQDIDAVTNRYKEH